MYIDCCTRTNSAPVPFLRAPEPCGRSRRALPQKLRRFAQTILQL